MGLFKRLFGSSDKKESAQESNYSKKKQIPPIQSRERIQTIKTISGLEYSIIRTDGTSGLEVRHYTFRDQKGDKIIDFPIMIWLFDNMVKFQMEGIPDYQG